MSQNLLDPERLETLDRIMSLYGKHLQTGDKLRIGIEGDPCSRFRSVDEAPSVTVSEILERKEDGLIRFKAIMSGSEETCEFTNRSFDPEFVWELHPDSAETFKQRIRKGGEKDQYRSVPNEDDLSSKMTLITQDMSQRLATLEDTVERLTEQLGSNNYRGNREEDIEHMKESERTFRETMASTIRALAGDTLRLARGEPVEFAHQYADRYDLALEERSNSTFRGSESPTPKKKSQQQHQPEKWSFDTESYKSNRPVTVTKSELSISDDDD